jgi:hypothetical protein
VSSIINAILLARTARTAASPGALGLALASFKAQASHNKVIQLLPLAETRIICIAPWASRVPLSQSISKRRGSPAAQRCILGRLARIANLLENRARHVPCNLPDCIYYIIAIGIFAIKLSEQAIHPIKNERLAHLPDIGKIGRKKVGVIDQLGIAAHATFRVYHQALFSAVGQGRGVSRRSLRHGSYCKSEIPTKGRRRS